MFRGARVIVFLFISSVLLLTYTNMSPSTDRRSRFASNSQDRLPVNTQVDQMNTSSASPEEFARGRILVVPRAGLPAHALKNMLNEFGGKARKLGQSEIHIVDVPVFSEESILSALQLNPHIKIAELDYKHTPTLIPNDPYFTGAWHLPKIGATEAWSISQGASITIAILDSGINNIHPDLETNILPGWNFYDNNSDTQGVTSHGTYVAGTAAALTNNNLGVASLAGLAKVLPLRVTDISGNSYSSTISEGLTYAADHGARVANASFLGLTKNSIIRSAAQYMKDKGGLVIVSGGNTGIIESFTPTSSMISVAATDQNDAIANFSSYGDYITLSAPGVNIWSTNFNLTSPYAPVAGSSIASPVVAGVVALMMSANPTLSSYDIETLLFSTAVDLGDPGRDIYFGYGRVDAAAAVLAAKNAVPTADTTLPIISITNPLAGATVSGIIPVDVTASDNIGVTRVELWVNNTNIATDTTQPFAFSWDTTSVASGSVNLEARAFDQAGNSNKSIISINVSNALPPPVVDTQAPNVQITNPIAGNVTGTVIITTSANDNSGSAGITQSLFIDNKQVATGTGSTLSYSWNTKPKSVARGSHIIKVTAKDAANNSTTTSVTVNVVK